MLFASPHRDHGRRTVAPDASTQTTEPAALNWHALFSQIKVQDKVSSLRSVVYVFRYPHMRFPGGGACHHDAPNNLLHRLNRDVLLCGAVRMRARTRASLYAV